MYHLLMVLGLVVVAVIVAMTPLMNRLLDYLSSFAESDGAPAEVARPRSAERSEMRDEIRRLTVALEAGRAKTPR